MDKLIENYKLQILKTINESNYTPGFILRMRREILMDDFTIPAEKVDEMLRKVRQNC